MFTIDASVWVNADSPNEPQQPMSRSLLDRLRGGAVPIFLPTLLAAEVAGVISRTRGNPLLAEQMASALLALPSVRWIPLDDRLGRLAAELAAKHRLRGADAVYAAVALANGCELISLDQEHLTRLTAVVRTSTPAEVLSRLGS